MATIKYRRCLPNCPFCKKEISGITFVSSQNFNVIYNQSPILPGHSLIIPKFHIESFLDLDNDELIEFSKLSQRAINILLAYFNCSSFNLSLQEFRPAGQTVPHLHLHIIPRKFNDLPKPGDWYPQLVKAYDTDILDSGDREKLTQKQMIKIATAIRKYIEKNKL